MKRFYKKLKSRRGASMIFALLVFVLCVLAGTAALTAASANIGRYARLENEQRRYFSAASALELLQSRLDAKTAATTVKVTYTETETWWYDASVLQTNKTYAVEVSDSTGRTIVDLDGLNYFQKLLLLNCVPDEWWTNSITTKPSTPFAFGEKTYTVELQDPADAWKDSIYKVTATVKGKSSDTDANFNLAMELTTEGGAYPLEVVWSGEAVTTTETKTTTTGGDPTDPSSTDSGTRTTTTLTCTVRWSAENRVVSFKRDD